jgi:WhiB family redox-sensing transcriptional regulator
MARSTSQLQPISEAWEWQILGRCRDRNGTQFFHPDDDLGRISRRLREAAAKRVCDGCPVRRQCATHALTVGEEYGVWGGFSESDRSMLRELGWRDAIDGRRLADVSTLERRLRRARAKAQEAKERRDVAERHGAARTAAHGTGAHGTGAHGSAALGTAAHGMEAGGSHRISGAGAATAASPVGSGVVGL